MGYTLNIKGKLMDLSVPRVMGILNATPDSFFAGSRKQTDDEIAARANAVVEEGGDIVDVGAFSTRPGASVVDEAEEMSRLRRALAIVRREQPDVPLSVDTYRPDVARMCVEEFGADIINDVSEGGITGIVDQPADVRGDMFDTVAKLGVAYVLMSVKPDLRTMIPAFAEETTTLHSLGVKDILLDPGFGFGKTIEQNFALMSGMERLQCLRKPLLVGISRKSMIWKTLGTDPQRALNGTTMLNTIALAKGASVLRVHDVRECVEVVRLMRQMPPSTF